MALEEISTETRVIIVDDDNDLRELIVEELKKSEFVIHEADNITTALTKLSNHVFDLIVLDLKIGDSTSAELIRWIRSHKKKSVSSLPIILISGYLDNQVLKTLSGSISSAFIKPFEISDLIKKINELT